MAASYRQNAETFSGLSLSAGFSPGHVSAGFSPGDARYFARAEPSGSLRIWDTESGRLKHEYSPSSHLSATCCFVAWAPNKRAATINESPMKKKKRKSGISQAIESLELIAIGTTSGSMMLYSAAKAELSTQLGGGVGGTEGHADRVTGISWSESGETLYSCSLDTQIIEWNVGNASIVHKWKGDKSSLYSIQLCHTQRHLLTASRNIKLWDLQTRQVLKTFVGHATEVFSLHIVPGYSRTGNMSDCNGSGDVESSRSINGSYIISAALNDRKISVWQVASSGAEESTERTCKDVTGSFSLQEDPLEVQVRPAVTEHQPLQLSVLTQSGKISLFEHVLNGRLKKPLKPRGVVEFVTSGTARPGDSPRPLSIVASGITGGATSTEHQIVVAYEDFIRPVFEKLNVSDLQQNSTCLIRADPAYQSSITTSESCSKVKTPQVSKDLTVLAPGYMAPAGPARHDDSDPSAARKRKRRKSFEMTLEERLNAIDDDAPSSISSSAVAGVKRPPKADSLAILLEQGLQSGDKKILNNVLQRTDTSFIRNTVSRLSPGVVVSLIKELTRRMQGHAQSQRTVLLWVNSVLTLHKAFLTSLPDVDELVQPLRQILYSPTELLERLLQINVQLKSFLAQGSAAEYQSKDVSEDLSSRPALVVYQNESSDEEDIFVDHDHHVTSLVPEDDWEEDSDTNDHDVQSDDSDDDNSDRRDRKDDEDSNDT